MKNMVEKSFLTGIICFLLLFFIVISSANSQESGWENKGDYLEQKLKIGNISFLQYSKDGKHFYTFGADNIFRKWESESGKLIEFYKIPYKCSSFDLSPNEDLIAIAKRNTEEFSRRRDTLIIYDYRNALEIYKINPEGDLPKEDQFSYERIECTMEFITDSTILTGIKIRKDFFYGSGDDIGNTKIINFRDSISKNINGTCSDLIKFSNNKDYVLLLSNTDGYYKVAYDTYVNTGRSVMLLYDKNLDTGKYFYDVGQTSKPDENININRITNGYFSNDLKYVFGKISNNSIVIWDLLSGKQLSVFKYNGSNVNLVPDDIAFTKDNNYFITSFSNQNSIKFCDFESGIVCDSIMNVSGKIVPTKDSVSLLIIKAGTIRLFQPSILRKKVKAIFKSDTNKVYVNQSLKFQNYSHGLIRDYFWSFGDGKESTEKNPAHKFEKPGSHVVTLVVSDGNNHDLFTQADTIYVLEEIIPDFSMSVNNGYSPLTVQFTDKSKGTMTKWSWDFGDGGKSTEQNPVYTYEKEGEFTINYIVSDNVFNYSMQKQISVFRPPIKNLEVIFEKDYGSNNYNWSGLSGIECMEGGYVINGWGSNYDYETENGESFSYIIRIDEKGDTIWTKKLEQGVSVQQVNDGGFILVGKARKNASDFLVIKLDKHGNKVWENIYGSANDDDYKYILATPDSGYIISAHSYFGYPLKSMLLKVNKNNQQEFMKPYNGAGGQHVRNHKNGGYLFVSYNGSSFFVFRLDKYGSKIWSQEFKYQYSLYCQDILEYNNGYIIAGQMDHNDQTINDPGFVYYLNDNGSKIWEYQSPEDWINYNCFAEYKGNIFLTGDLSGRLGFHILNREGQRIEKYDYPNRICVINSIEKTKDNGLFLIGTIKPPFGNSKIFALKINGETSDVKYLNEAQTSKPFPNPNFGSGIIKFTNEKAGNIEIELFALTGTKLKTIVNNWYSEGEHEIPFLLDEIVSGVYYYTIKQDGKLLSTNKIVYMR